MTTTWKTLGWTLLVGLVLSTGLWAHEATYRLPLPGFVCRDGTPFAVWVVNASSATDCSTGGGTIENECCCLDGSWVDCVGAGSGVTSHGDLTDLLVDDHTQYPFSAGRVGGQEIIGGTAAADDLLVRANSTSDYPFTFMDGDAGGATWTAKASATRGYTATPGGLILDIDNVADSVIVRSSHGASSDNVFKVSNIGVVSGRRLCADESAPDSAAPCISEDGSGRMFHDTDGDGVKETGEEYIDQAGGGSGAPTDADYLVKTANGSLSAERVVTDTDTITWNWATGGQAKAEVNLWTVAPYQQYDPDRAPGVCTTDSSNNFCEDFTGDTEALSWSWANQGSASISFDHDMAHFVGDTTNQYRMRLIDTPSSGNVDFTIIAKVASMSNTSTTNGCGITLVHGGTKASPGAHMDLMAITLSQAIGFWTDGDMDAGAGVGTPGTISIDNDYMFTVPYYLKFSYVDSTRVVTGSMGWQDSKVFRAIATSTASADPVAVGMVMRREGNCWFEWVRVRTDSDKEWAGE